MPDTTQNQTQNPPATPNAHRFGRLDLGVAAASMLALASTMLPKLGLHPAILFCLLCTLCGWFFGVYVAYARLHTILRRSLVACLFCIIGSFLVFGVPLAVRDLIKDVSSGQVHVFGYRSLLLPVFILFIFCVLSINSVVGCFRTILGGATTPHRLLSIQIAGILIGWVYAAIAIPSMFRFPMAANESAAISACFRYAEAQGLYHRTDWDGDGVLEYARSIGGENGLFERFAGSGDLYLVDGPFADAEYKPQPSQLAKPKAGYLFRVLTGQGPGAIGGEMSYLETGSDGKVRMTKGYALVAFPADYDGTGRNTFITNQDGTVYQRDLGPETQQLVEQMTVFDPTYCGRWLPSQ